MCGVAWKNLPQGHVVDSLTKPKDLAPTGAWFPKKEEILASKYAGFLREEIPYDVAWKRHFEGVISLEKQP